MKTQHKSKRKHRKHRRPRWQRHAYTYIIRRMQKIQWEHAKECLQEIEAESKIVYKQQYRHNLWGIGGIVHFVVGMFIIAQICRPIPESYRYHAAIALLVVLIIYVAIRDSKRRHKDYWFSHRLDELSQARREIYHNYY